MIPPESVHAATDVDVAMTSQPAPYCTLYTVQSTPHFIKGLVAPISVNFNHQLAYFADQSDTTHVPHQPTAVA